MLPTFKCSAMRMIYFININKYTYLSIHTHKGSHKDTTFSHVLSLKSHDIVVCRYYTLLHLLKAETLVNYQKSFTIQSRQMRHDEILGTGRPYDIPFK